MPTLFRMACTIFQAANATLDFAYNTLESKSGLLCLPVHVASLTRTCISSDAPTAQAGRSTFALRVKRTLSGPVATLSAGRSFAHWFPRKRARSVKKKPVRQKARMQGKLS
jgi:hypothetical protein